MYRVVIIDDEPIIVEGISRIVPWEKYNCKIVSTANDGMEGAEVIRKYKPNIVISDIAMPGVDGLTMVAGLKSEFPDVQISILTGYRDFDYAQKAIRLGVVRFLLKPSNLEEIEEAVRTMVDNLSKNDIFPEIEEECVALNDTEIEVDGDAYSEEDSEKEAKKYKKINADDGEDKTSHLAGSFVVNNAIRYIENNYKQKLSLADVAEKAYVSQWHLSKLLNRHYGQNFSEILNNIRIREAKKLLADPSLRIGGIATSVGFVDIAHFSRVFKKSTGISANEYRNSL